MNILEFYQEINTILNDPLNSKEDLSKKIDDLIERSKNSGLSVDVSKEDMLKKKADVEIEDDEDDEDESYESSYEEEDSYESSYEDEDSSYED